MGKDYNQIKSTVLPEGVRRLTKLIGIVAAIPILDRFSFSLFPHTESLIASGILNNDK